MRYLVTTNSSKIPLEDQVFMVDGTVPGWIKKGIDYHKDHHRVEGEPVQILELDFPQKTSLVEEMDVGKEQVIVTTQIDADACVAGAFVQLPKYILEDKDVYDRLEAIAWDCDHLVVPSRLSHLADFAAQAVAGMKVESDKIAEALGYPENHAEWTVEMLENYSTKAFEFCIEWLILASKGEAKWPGEKGEAEEYWSQVKGDSKELLEKERVSFFKGVPIFDTRDFDHLVDPRACLMALKEMEVSHLPMTITVKKHNMGGSKYTLGCDPLHPEVNQIDYTKSTYKELSRAENMKELVNLDRKVWGGRKTVGGSGWNHPTTLTPEEVADIVLRNAFA